MSQEDALDFLREMLTAYREKKPITTVALICAVAWIVTVYIIGKAALLLAIPATLVALVKEAG